MPEAVTSNEAISSHDSTQEMTRQQALRASLTLLIGGASLYGIFKYHKEVMDFIAEDDGGSGAEIDPSDPALSETP